MPEIVLNILVYGPRLNPDVQRTERMRLDDATDDADNEANAVRKAEQMVREAFRRLRLQKDANK